MARRAVLGLVQIMAADQAERPRSTPAALLGGLLGGVLTAAVTGAVLLSKTRLWTSSSTAPIGIIFVIPVVAAMLAILGSILGASLGYLASGWRHGRRLRERGMVVAGLLVVAVAGWAAWETVPELVLGRKVRAVEQMSEPTVGQVLEDRTFGHDVFVLAAIAGNPRASGETLDRLTQRSDPELHTRHSSFFDDVQGKNTREEAVMRLVAQNPNVRPESIEWLARSPNVSTVAFVASNRKLSEETVQRLATSTDQEVLRGVAWNPKMPPELLERLSRSEDRYIRMGVADNSSTPSETLRRLESDPDEFVRRQARRTHPAPLETVPPFRQ